MKLLLEKIMQNLRAIKLRTLWYNFRCTRALYRMLFYRHPVYTRNITSKFKKFIAYTSRRLIKIFFFIFKIFEKSDQSRCIARYLKIYYSIIFDNIEAFFILPEDETFIFSNVKIIGKATYNCQANQRSKN